MTEMIGMIANATFNAALYAALFLLAARSQVRAAAAAKRRGS